MTYKTEYQTVDFIISQQMKYMEHLVLDPNDLFTEKTPYAQTLHTQLQKSFKSDMIIRAYNETYGLNTVITNCSNNYGPKQHDEKLIPTIIRNALKKSNSNLWWWKNIRDWLYVLDHCKGIDLVYHNGKKEMCIILVEEMKEQIFK